MIKEFKIDNSERRRELCWSLKAGDVEFSLVGSILRAKYIDELALFSWATVHRKWFGWIPKGEVK